MLNPSLKVAEAIAAKIMKPQIICQYNNFALYR